MTRTKHSRTLTILVLLAVVVAGAVTPRIARARGGARDPLLQWEQQRRRTEQRKTKRREELDDQGAEMRDTKKSAEDSKQTQQLQDFGAPNPQSDRWTGF